MNHLTAEQQATIQAALDILSGLFQRLPLEATMPQYVKDYCRLQIGHLEHEVFGVLYLDNQHHLIHFEPLFRGTIDGASVYPREVVKQVLNWNSAAVIFCHNHPSGVTEPSAADKRITSRLIEALRLIDVRVLDHIIVSNVGDFSFAEQGLL